MNNSVRTKLLSFIGLIICQTSLFGEVKINIISQVCLKDGAYRFALIGDDEATLATLKKYLNDNLNTNVGISIDKLIFSINRLDTNDNVKQIQLNEDNKTLRDYKITPKEFIRIKIRKSL